MSAMKSAVAQARELHAHNAAVRSNEAIQRRGLTYFSRRRGVREIASKSLETCKLTDLLLVRTCKLALDAKLQTCKFENVQTYKLASKRTTGAKH